jgi:hypothetical protein
MAELARHDSLYQDVLASALSEARDLASEIDRLKHQLARLEERKQAVEDVCRAIRRWVDVTADDGLGDDNAFMPDLGEWGGAVRLTEEEVSMIAYPKEPPGES